MSQREIVAMVIAGLQEVSNREKFLQERFNRAMRGSGSAVGIFLASTPDSLREDVVSIHDRNIQGVMQESSPIRDTIMQGRKPISTLQGPEGQVRPTAPNFRFEIHRSDHIEICLHHATDILATIRKPLWDESGERLETVSAALDGNIIVRAAVEFLHRARRLYHFAGTFESFALTLIPQIPA